MTRKQQIWLAAYLVCWNATEAARRAGYKWPNKVGPYNLTRFKDEIRRALDEAAMTADETLIRLAERARFDVSPYLIVEAGRFRLDLVRLIEDGHGRHIKSIKPTKDGDQVEFHDGQACLVLLAKHHRLLDDRTQVDGEVRVTFGFADPAEEEPHE